MKIFFINLDSSRERRQKIEEQLAEIDMKSERVSALSGGDRGLEKLSLRYTSFKAKFLNGRGLTRGEIGCTASHLACAKRIVAEDLDWAVVLEDDVRIPENFVATLREVATRTLGFDLVSLHTFRLRGNAITIYKISRGFSIQRFVGRRTSSAALILHRSGALKLSELTDIAITADKYHFMELLYGLRTAIVQPNLIELDAVTSNDSDISQIDGSTSLRDKKRSNLLWRIFVSRTLKWMSILSMRRFIFPMNNNEEAIKISTSK
jgi:glycosyl transferase, family 25